MNIEFFEKISNPIDLYYQFKDIFFGYMIKNIPEDDIVYVIIDYYQDYRFNEIRVLIDDTVSDKADICMLNNINNIHDEIDNLAYKNWKKLDDMYSYYYDKYCDLLNLNTK
jgi:hypothetical protein